MSLYASKCRMLSFGQLTTAPDTLDAIHVQYGHYAFVGNVNKDEVAVGWHVFGTPM